MEAVHQRSAVHNLISFLIGLASMSDNLCDKIEAVSKSITPGSNPEAAAPIIEALGEFNKSRILGSDLLKNANQAAQQMQEKGVHGEVYPPGVPGATGWIQQKDGKPNFLEIVDGNRTEGMRLDDNGEPFLNMVTQTCEAGKKAIQSAFFIRDGKRVLSSVTVIPNLEIQMDREGKPERIKPWY